MGKSLEIVEIAVDGTINVVKAIPSWLTFPKAIEQTTRTAEMAIVRAEDSYRKDVLPDFQKTTLAARNCIDGVTCSVRNCVDTVAYSVKIFSGIVFLLLIGVLILAMFVGPQVFGVFTLAFNVLAQALTLISRGLDVFSLMVDLVYRIVETIIRIFNSFSKALDVLLDSCDNLFAKIHLYDMGLPLLILLIIMINVRFLKRIRDIFNKAEYQNETVFERNNTMNEKPEPEQKQTHKREQNSGTGTEYQIETAFERNNTINKKPEPEQKQTHKREHHSGSSTEYQNETTIERNNTMNEKPEPTQKQTHKREQNSGTRTYIYRGNCDQVSTAQTAI